MSDSRFFHGYMWVSEHADCSVGLCFQTTDPKVAADQYVQRGRLHYQGAMRRDASIFVMASAESAPVRFDYTRGQRIA